MTYAQILALPVQENTRLLKASDNGLFYVIETGESGANAKVCTLGPDDNYVTGAEKLLIGGIPALTFAGSDPNIENNTVRFQSVPLGDSGQLLATGNDPQTEGVIWSTDGNEAYPGSGTWWRCSRGAPGSQWTFQKYTGEFSVVSVLSSDLTDWPEDATWGVGQSVTRTSGAADTATHLGQWCKASTAWWQWDDTAWIPRFTLAGQPITYRASPAGYFSIGVDSDSALQITTFP